VSDDPGGQWSRPAPPVPPINPPPPVGPAPPAYGQPAYGEYAQPAYGQPNYAQPNYAQPNYGQPYPQQGGWAPPPKPGLMPLRPLSFGALLGTPFQVLRRNPRATFGSALLVQLGVMIVTALAVGGVTFFAFGRIFNAESGQQDTITAGSIALIIIAGLFTVAVSIIGSALLQGILVVEVARATLGEKPTMGGLWRGAGKRLWPLIGWFGIIIAAVLVAVGILAAIVVIFATVGSGLVVLGVLLAVFLGLGAVALGVWLGTKTALVPSIIVLERLGIGASIRRSWSLTNGYFWKTFGVLALVYAILNAATQIISTPLSLVVSILPVLLFPNGTPDGAAVIIVVSAYGLSLIVSVVLGALVSVVQSATVPVVYLDLRMRKEGLDLDLIRYVENRQLGYYADGLADPYAVAARHDPYGRAI
jgi:hypothetical protein